MPNRVEMPSLAFIVARSTPGHVIGERNQLPWHLKSDLQRFKRLTLGHVMIMGRKTHESIGRVLPGRTTIVLSRGADLRANTAETLFQDTALVWARGRDEALVFADALSIVRGKETFFVIGGAEVFAMFSDLFETVYLTEVIAEITGDARFDLEFESPAWRRIEAESHPASPGDQYPSRFVVYERRERRTRSRNFPDLLADAAARRDWLRRTLPNMIADAAGRSSTVGRLEFPHARS
ncbi:MAG TPA: dihydrofolate reductase [Xanthobacteraceae bacterium]|jgi:dihydrofolate reductase|nr:dihydrofolate reductase [Xanthobacteraceae bacterium]